MASCLLGLGANLADRAATIQQAIDSLAAHADIQLVASSSLKETTPVGGPAGQDEFLNAAALVETALSPHDLLRALLQIEADLGRERHERWAARNIDIDLLLYDDLVLETDDLVLPHPRMSFRRFVIEPAAEIAPDMRHPQIGWTLAQLRNHLRDQQPYVAIAGPIGVGKSHLARRLCDELGGRLVPENVSDERLTAFYDQASPHHGDDSGQPQDSASQRTAETRPTGLSWATEIEFLQDRTQQLAQATWPSEPGLAISDYWFEQSLAFAQVWLPTEQHAKYRKQWEAAKQTVVAPKLLVVLDAPVETLQKAIAERARPYEQALSAETLDRLRQSLIELVTAGRHGPVLSLSTADPQRLFDEVTAAIAAMQ